MAQPTPPPAEEQPGSKKRKRPRAIQACERCRLKKYKCDESYPCLHCKKAGLECNYVGGYRPRESSPLAGHVQTLELKVKELTAQLSAKQNGPVPQQQRRRMSVPVGNTNTTGTYDTPTDSEITDVNQHTNATEFHGSTSSLAFLGHLQELGKQRRSQPAAQNGSSLISDLHNPAFSPPNWTATGQSPGQRDGNFYFKHAHTFIEGYFGSLHFIHPLIDKDEFITRANNLWLNYYMPEDASFIALYHSLLSLGALIRPWDEERLDGLTRFEWSRKLFSEAQARLNELQFSNDLETVQCLYLMAKICQNELNPNRTWSTGECIFVVVCRLQQLMSEVAYMYLGLAIRTSLSAGFNRETSNPKNKNPATLSKTWWGIYSLEIEMSFALGRPDTLGMDEYHNRRLPEIDDSEYAIISCMIDFAQLMRKVSVSIHHSVSPVHEKITLALQIEQDLDSWLMGLPYRIKPNLSTESSHLGSLREPKWCRRQRLVLEIRYHNVKMLLFRPFLSHFVKKQRHVSEDLLTAVNKCVSSATKTIEIIHETFRLHVYFRTWWYNTTYVMFAASILLLYTTQVRDSSTPGHIVSIEKSIEILEAMDESVVAKKSGEIVKRCLNEVRNSGVSDFPVAPDNTRQPDFANMDQYNGFDFLDYSFQDLASLFAEINEPLGGDYLPTV